MQRITYVALYLMFILNVAQKYSWTYHPCEMQKHTEDILINTVFDSTSRTSPKLVLKENNSLPSILRTHLITKEATVSSANFITITGFANIYGWRIHTN